MGSHNPCSWHLKAKKLQAINVNIACIFKPLRKYESGVKHSLRQSFILFYTLCSIVLQHMSADM